MTGYATLLGTGRLRTRHISIRFDTSAERTVPDPQPKVDQPGDDPSFVHGGRDRYAPQHPAPADGTLLAFHHAAEMADWLQTLLIYDDAAGCWELAIPHTDTAGSFGADTFGLIPWAQNTALRDPSDDTSARQWAARLIEQDHADEPDDTGAPLRVTEWRRIKLGERIGHVALDTTTAVCMTPFTGLQPATGSACLCQHWQQWQDAHPNLRDLP
ncbi:hypothetical protein OWR29_26115 [Actinoplanes sp. Pm04-4]|uniref:Uncharacterized protein n=1 Tax=Paractinoplanes pyxinae TaxID=2997416 RepID=A0ABT4B4Q5_9ACTN|nr:hypothetical protein [Actinoplanes pyxinae]MCY1141487.1 hypothetical protein [Actinoplanes pyxinae]